MKSGDNLQLLASTLVERQKSPKVKIVGSQYVRQAGRSYTSLQSIILIPSNV